jgi:AcrR family transcriptional regulator
MRLSKARKQIVTDMMRDTIYQAAGSVLRTHGVGGMTMDRVATVAGLAKGSLYNYFHDKSELVQFIYERLVDPFLSHLRQVAAEEDVSAPKKLEKILRFALEQSLDNRGIIRLLAEADQTSSIRKTVRPQVLAIFSDIFEQGVQSGDFRPHNTAHTARMFLGAFGELFEMQADNASDEELHAFAGILIDAVLNGFSIHI